MKENDQSRLQRAMSDRNILEQVARSPDAQALAGMLTQGKDPASLQQIAEKAAKGDTAQLKALVQSITATPGGAELLRRLGNSFGQR